MRPGAAAVSQPRLITPAIRKSQNGPKLYPGDRRGTLPINLNEPSSPKDTRIRLRTQLATNCELCGVVSRRATGFATRWRWSQTACSNIDRIDGSPRYSAHISHAHFKLASGASCTVGITYDTLQLRRSCPILGGSGHQQHHQPERSPGPLGAMMADECRQPWGAMKIAPQDKDKKIDETRTSPQTLQ